MFIGLAIAISTFIFINGVFLALVLTNDRGPTQDVGDVFKKAVTVGQYADRRLQAAATDHPLPQPPDILADLVSVKLGFATTLVYETLLIAIAGGASGLTPAEFARKVGLSQFRWRGLWRPGLAVFGAYAMVIAYALAINAIGIDFLRPQSTIPSAVTRDSATLAMAAVLAAVAAPLSEEVFFRGFIFGGLLKWGFWPAAAISAGCFTLAHLDPGSVIPFFGIGLMLAYLYWSRGSLWDSIAFHFLFNSTSLLLLFAGA